MNLNTPKKIINHYRYLEYRKFAICDGISEVAGIENILYILFTIFGVYMILQVLNKYVYIKDTIKEKLKGEKKR